MIAYGGTYTYNRPGSTDAITGPFVTSGVLSSDACLPYSSSASVWFKALHNGNGYPAQMSFVQDQGKVYGGPPPNYPGYPYWGSRITGLVSRGLTIDINTFPYGSDKNVKIAPGWVQFSSFQSNAVNKDPFVTYPSGAIGGYINSGILSESQNLSYGQGLITCDPTWISFIQFQNHAVEESTTYSLQTARGYVSSGCTYKYSLNHQIVPFNSVLNITIKNGSEFSFEHVPIALYSINPEYYGWIKKAQLATSVILPKGPNNTALTQFYANDKITVTGTGDGTDAPDRWVLSSVPSR